MLFSLIDLTEASATSEWQPYATHEATAEAVNPQFRPEDPTTLTLALIGAATLAVYLAIRRTARDRGIRTGGFGMLRGRLPDASAVAVLQSSEADDDQPSRGAA
jgi:hypothetical protein